MYVPLSNTGIMCPEDISSRDELVALVSELLLRLEEMTAEQARLQDDLTQMSAEQIRLQSDNAQLQSDNAHLQADNSALSEEVRRLQEELKKKGDPPSWAHANKEQPADKPPRTKRARGYGRRCAAEPDECLTHAVEICPDCGQPLTGGWEAYTHESLVFPKETVRVVQHVCLARRCGVCGKVVVGRPDPVTYGLVGQRRVDARGMSLITYWHIICRIPLRIIQQLLIALYACDISLGGLREILQGVATAGSADYTSLRDTVREEPWVHMDETGWRENGQNGYVWAAVTPLIRYFERHGTRSGAVPKEILGLEYCGIVICDGYGGYDGLSCQLLRCWVHILRKGHELKMRHPEATDACAWVDIIHQLYLEAQELISQPEYAKLVESIRATYRQSFEQRLLAHVTPALTSTILEQARLAKFISRKINELFVFVQYPDVPSENNPAERAVRPIVIARKVCGGSRSEDGSKTKMILMSLLYTALVRKIDPIVAVEQMLLGKPMFAK